jgi:hypothetical protein
MWTALLLLSVVACTTSAATWPGSSSAPAVTGSSGFTAAASLPGSAVPSTLDDIPPGRSIAEGGGGPLTYTFREEWRRARAEAWKSRPGAYLVMAAGSYVNDDGVPSSWSMSFLSPGADALVAIEIDAWGKVTATKAIAGAEIASRLGGSTGRIPFSILDSDRAVSLGKAALGRVYDLTRTKDPSLGLNNVAAAGPRWIYTVFNNVTAAYVTARIDALTGEVTLN